MKKYSVILSRKEYENIFDLDMYDKYAIIKINDAEILALGHDVKELRNIIKKLNNKNE